MKLTAQKQKWLKIGVLAALLAVITFAIYLFFLNRQMDRAFSQQNEHVPTRLYSDVTRVASPMLRSQIEARLTALSYRFVSNAEEIHFVLRPIDYPTILVPDTYAGLEAAEVRQVTLSMSGAEADAVIQGVNLNGQEVPEIYLEPELVSTLSRADEKEIRDPVHFADIPANVWKAIISVEDQHFLEHGGFDVRGIARAFFVNLRTFSLAQGGSTITQQLVKNLMGRHTRNIFLKFNEFFLAVLLEARYSKEEILERYLNEVNLGQVGNLEIHGVAEGAEHFYGKKLADLNLAEIALMAGLVRGTAYYSPYRYLDRALERQRLVLKKMVETGHIAAEEADEAAKQPIHLMPPRKVMNKAPYFTDFVKAELLRIIRERDNHDFTEEGLTSVGYRVYTTIDLAMNSIAQKSVTDGVDSLEKKYKAKPTEHFEGALAAVDHSTGFVRALIGGRNYGASTFNRILNMKRQVGSTFKPFVYLTALNGAKDPAGTPFTPAYPIEDAPWTLTYDNQRQSWSPRNYEKDYRGWISLRQALAHSVNTVAAKLGVQVGIAEVIKTARALGIQSDLPEVPSLSLGVSELSPVELLRAYAALANHGKQDQLTVIRAITTDNTNSYVARFNYTPREVFPAGPVDLLTDMLQNVFIEGSARGAYGLGFDRPAAGKTGTTSNYRDSWFAGYTPQLTAVVWVGLDQMRLDEKTRIKLTGAGAALPIWARFMNAALAGEAPAAFPLSPALTQMRIDTRTGKKAQSGCPDSQVTVERVVIGNEPTAESCETMYPPSQTKTEI